ncbi:MAG: hypothetical protein KatS3mg105_4151 [Gemmatales bacterium]|nr:MAG: hypothetical protein KatS3mg105_4151 [Gemmatales bacterium]
MFPNLPSQVSPARKLYRWFWPVAISGLVHALLFALLSLTPGPNKQTNRNSIDTRVSGAFDLVLNLDAALADPRKEVRPAVAEEEESSAPATNGGTSESNKPARTVPEAKADRGYAHSRRGGNESGTGRNVIRFFTVPARGRSVVYVLDRSVSMGLNGLLEVVKTELLHSLAELPSDARFQVIFYNRHARKLHFDKDDGLMPATKDNKRRAAEQLRALVAEGSTRHLEAIRQAIALRPEVIYFLTDADSLSPADVDAITQLNQGKTSIHTISICRSQNSQAEATLRLLAMRNRGTFQPIRVR